MARFDSAGAKLIAIGVGTPDKARILADRVSDLVLNFVLGGIAHVLALNPGGN